MRMNRFWLPVICMAALLASNDAGAQTVMLEKAVIAAGGGRASNSAMTLDYTIGQPVTGRASSEDLQGGFGFHQGEATALSVHGPGSVTGITGVQVTPNPVTDRVELRIEQAENGRLIVQLYDAAGRLVRDLFDGRNEAGTVVLPVDLAGLPSGTYYAAVQVSGTLVQRQFVVLR